MNRLVILQSLDKRELNLILSAPTPDFQSKELKRIYNSYLNLIKFTWKLLSMSNDKYLSEEEMKELKKYVLRMEKYDLKIKELKQWKY